MTTATVHPVAARAAADLRTIREQWGDLLAAIDGPRDRTWPPRDARDFDRPAPDDDEPAVGRIPLTLREHPAPVNLDALDAALAVERDLFEQADIIATAVQRPVRRDIWPAQGHRTYAAVDADDRDDPARWHYAAPTSPGSRAYGLHWAAVWCEGRVLGEDVGDLFRPLPEYLLAEAAAVARRARQRVEAALGRDGRRTVLDRPCPWCGGTLTAHTAPGDPEATIVRCGTGPDCTAPVELDRGRRTWCAPDLPGLYGALSAAEERRTA